MTGFGLGWILADRIVAAQLMDLQFITHQAAPDLPSQAAAATALTDPVRDEHPAKSVEKLRANALLVKDALEKLPGCRCPLPDAGQFCFPYVGRDDLELCKQLKSEHKVLTVPGSVWGQMGEGHLRLAIAVEQDYLQEGLSRIVSGLGS